MELTFRTGNRLHWYHMYANARAAAALGARGNSCVTETARVAVVSTQ
jgi:hypothetical protein